MRMYLILWGADNEAWTCMAKNSQSALDQFAEADLGDWNEIYLCTPALFGD